MALAAMDWQLSKETLMDRIESIFKTSQWSDCSFHVGQSSVQIFKAHRLILASSSPVFEAMCFGPLAEKKCITISDMEPEVFRILLEYIYTDKVKLTSCEEAAGVLYAAKKYMIPHLARVCGEYLATNLRPSNVLSVFEFAEDLQEDKLLDACVKVLCKHTEEVLKSPGCHISSFTLRTLLEQNALNIAEAELFNISLDWAKKECQRLELDCSSENIRNVLMKAGVLSKIRFLCLTPEEFRDGPLHSGILKPEEIYFFKKAMQKIQNSNDRKFYHGLVDMPPGWNSAVKPRSRIAINQVYCVRRFLKTAVTVTGQVRLLTNVQVDCSIVVSGVRIFTRLMPATFNYNIHSPPQKYKENIEVSVLDPEGAIISHTHFTDVVEYNTLATVALHEAVRFSCNKEYSFLFVLPTGEDQLFEYPLSFMAQTEHTRGMEFRFCDHADMGGTGVFVRRLDMGYVDAILYSV